MTILASSIVAGAATINTTASTTCVIAVPVPVGGIKSDDILVIVCHANTAALITSLGGSWVDYMKHSGTADTLSPSSYIAYRRAAGGDTATTVTTPNVSNAGVMYCIRGGDLQAFVDFVASTMFIDQSTAQSTCVNPAGTTTRKGTALIGSAINNAPANTMTTFPSGWTASLTPGGAGNSGASAYFLQDAIGTTGTVTWTFSGSGKSVGQVIPIRPGPPRSGLGLGF